MSEKALEGIRKQRIEDVAQTKDISLNELKTSVEKLPTEKQGAPVIWRGLQAFTPRRLITEVENDTEIGKEICQMLTSLRMGLLMKDVRGTTKGDVTPVIPPEQEMPKPKVMLLIRNKLKDIATDCSYGWAEQVKNHAGQMGWKVIDLAGDNATRENVEKALEGSLDPKLKMEPKFVCHYGLGNQYVLWGQESGELEPVIDGKNVILLKNRVTSTMGALSASGLGPMAISAGSVSYLGYKNFFWFSELATQDFGECVNAVNKALLDGQSTFKAIREGNQCFFNKAIEYAEQDLMLLAEFFYRNYESLTLLGNYSTTMD